MHYLYFGLAAAGGAYLRSGLGTLLNKSESLVPFGTLAANLLGAFGLALLLFGLADKRSESEELIWIVGTGFFGAFTTYSSYNVELFNLLKAQSYTSALGYFLLTTFLALSLAALAHRLTRG